MGDQVHSSPLVELQSRYGLQLDKRLQHWLDRSHATSDFGGMMRYQLGYTDERLQPTSAPAGKRFRPLLCLLACETAGGNGEAALDIAASIELLHNFSLVHDDIQDRDPARRHRPTVWKLWGEAQGINVGDGLFALASRAVLELPDADAALAIGKAFQDTAQLLTLGQFLDMNFESRDSVSIDEYLFMTSNKTAALVEFCIWSGARIATADQRLLEKLGEFGRELGVAYQIHDDVMGIWGTAEETGKLPGTDLRNCKKTLPILLAARRAGGVDVGMFGQYFAGAGVEYEEMRAALDRLEARRESQEVLVKHLDAAISSLEASTLGTAATTRFKNIALELTGQLPATS
jgi:geranylgeranyl diphosphate synthase type I